MRLNNYILNEGINDKGIWKAIFMAGTPGAGKSYVREKLGGGVEPRVVNTDTWTEFFGVKKGEWSFFKEDIKRISADQLSNYINSMLPLWVDGTSSKPGNTVSRQGMLEGFGYDTGMLWVNTDLDTAIDRAKEREKLIGRHVDTDFIVESYKKINKLKPYYKSNFKWFKEVDNNDGELTEKVMTKLHKEANSFFTQPLMNGLGKYYQDDLINNGGKYLIDSGEVDISMIKQKIKGWYSY